MNERDDGSRYWAGNHDCREAMRHKLQKLQDNGTFLSQWPGGNDIFLWLLHYQDTNDKGCNYETINEERCAMLPVWVRLMIGR